MHTYNLHWWLYQNLKVYAHSVHLFVSCGMLLVDFTYIGHSYDNGYTQLEHLSNFVYNVNEATLIDMSKYISGIDESTYSNMTTDKIARQNPWCILWDILCYRLVPFQQSSSFISVANSRRQECKLLLCLILKSEDGVVHLSLFQHGVGPWNMPLVYHMNAWLVFSAGLGL